MTFAIVRSWFRRLGSRTVHLATFAVTPFGTVDDSHERDEALFQQRLQYEEKKWREAHPESAKQ